MGPHPHDGRITITTPARKHELIILGSQCGLEIFERLSAFAARSDQSFEPMHSARPDSGVGPNEDPMRKYISIIISIAFLGYGLIRIGVGSALLGQELGLLDVEAFRAPIVDIAGFLAKSGHKQMVPVSVAGYVSYIALMGLVLSAGAIGSLRNQRLGLPLIGAFLVMYALLFVNFQTINPKAMHLAVCAVLFGALFWSKGNHGKVT
jgi:hypothetical protein